MQIDLRLAIWNANGLSNHRQEVEAFLSINKIDILLISETHFTSKSYFKINGYNLVNTNHPDDAAYGGTAILLKSNITFRIIDEFQEKYLQSTVISVVCENCPLTIGAVYFPPRFNLKQEDFTRFFDKLGSRFIVGGDFNSKHPWWGSRLSNPKGNELYKCVRDKNLSVISTGKPTYWPSDPQKIPDLLDFFIYNGIPRHHLDVLESFDLSSDHSPVFLVYSTTLCYNKGHLFSNRTDIDSFVYWIEKNINLNISLKTGEEIDKSVEYFTNLLHEASYLSTPQIKNSPNTNKFTLSSEIRSLISKKRKLRKIWQTSHHPQDKRNFNKITKELTQRLQEAKNNNIKTHLQNLNPSDKNDHNLWKAIKYIKRPQKRDPPIRNEDNSWLKSDQDKASAFASYLEKVFTPFNFNSGSSDEKNIIDFIDTPCPMDLPIKHIKPSEIREEINHLNPKKSPGYDQINAQMLKHIPKKGLLFLTYIFNAILRLSHFPSQWKCAMIIMIPKPNKPENCITSYRPISLLATFSKIFERIFIRRMEPLVEEFNIIPEHQFGFRHKHGTPEQCHRIVQYVTEALENKKYCSAVFLDVQQAFDRVWHSGLLYKLKKFLPTPYYLLLKSYLSDRFFYVKHNNDYSDFLQIYSGVPQGSVLGPVLYTIFTSDLPTSNNVLVATYADDTAILAASNSASEASLLVQNQLNNLQNWLIRWNIKVNSNKSNHITFTLRKGDCDAVKINNETIPHKHCVKYLGMHMDRRLTWNDHITIKRNQLDNKFKKLYWLLRPKSQLSIENKLRIYKAVLKPIWIYGIHLWGTACNSNIEILQRFQSKTLRKILDSPWFVTNNIIHYDLNMPKIKDEIKRFSEKYLNRLSDHTNILAICLLDDSYETKRLKRLHVLDLPFKK